MPPADPALQRDAEENTIGVLVDEAATRDLSSFMDAAVSMLHQTGYESDDTDQRARVLARHLMDCAALLAEARGRWIDGDEAFRPKVPTLPVELFPAPMTRQQRRNEKRKAEPAEPPAHKPVPIETLIEGWLRENPRTPKIAYEIRRIARTMAKIIGTDDAALVTADHAVLWKNARLASGSIATVRHEISIMSVLWKWGKVNRRLSFDQNPFGSIAPKRVTRGPKPRRPFTSSEAALLLMKARSEGKPLLRWLPWVAAYTGARLGEICHVKKEDVQLIQDVTIMDLHEEREKEFKTGQSALMVPLHPALIAEGFVEYVATLPAGSVLFPAVKPDLFGDRAGNATKIHGRWVRLAGVTDERVGLAHSWRHLFEDRARLIDMPIEVADALQGHETSGSEGRKHGDGLRDKPWKTREWMNRMETINLTQGDSA